MITTVYGFSAMGLFEIARERKELPLNNSFKLRKKGIEKL